MLSAVHEHLPFLGTDDPAHAPTGWLLFLVFAGVGFVALPMDLVRSWWGRPRATIPKSEYITRAMEMARKAKSVKVSCPAVRPLHGVALQEQTCILLVLVPT